MQVLKVIFILVEVLVLFNLLIFVHELGHFLAARWRGLKVERFAVWFGKPIWKKEINGIVYCLGSIPAGGYVALPQMASMEAIEGKTDAHAEQLPPISVADKIIVAFAGPLFSMGLAACFALVVWVVGRPVNEIETTTTIGYVFKGSPAEAAGLRVGDQFLQVDGKPVDRWSGIGDTVMWRMVRSEGDSLPITVRRDGRELTVQAHPIREKTEVWERRSLREISVLPKQAALVARVEEGMPAARGGLKPNDVILEVNGIPVLSPITVADEIRANVDKPVKLKVQRGKETFTTELTAVMPPETEATKSRKEERYPRIGIEWERGGRMDIDHPTPLTQLEASINAMASTLGAVFSRKSEIGLQHLSGPVGIVRIYYRLFESEQGWRLALWFSVVLNMNLALLNLVPLPVLDGGHILLACIEGVRRKPVNGRLIGFVQNSCAVLIIGYMLFVTFFDAQDWLPWKRHVKPAEAAEPATNRGTNH